MLIKYQSSAGKGVIEGIIWGYLIDTHLQMPLVDLICYIYLCSYFLSSLSAYSKYIYVRDIIVLAST